MTPWERVEATGHHLRESLMGIEQSLRRLTPDTVRQIVREEIRDALAAVLAAEAQAEQPSEALADVLHRQSADKKAAARRRTKPPGAESS
jgi:hypothetical protein